MQWPIPARMREFAEVGTRLPCACDRQDSPTMKIDPALNAESEQESQPTESSGVSRRELLTAAATGLAATSLVSTAAPTLQAATKGAGDLKGNIRHSIVQWCFQPFWELPKTCQVAKELGIESIELIPPEQWPTLKEHGLKCAIAPSHGFVKGLNDPAHWDECLASLRKAIEQAAAADVPSVITFTGFAGQIALDEGQRNCVTALKKIAGLAEQKKVTICLEMLNSRVSDHPMKGHPGYQGDHTDYCVEILKAVGSPFVKLLFDVYHVQIMDGDVIRRIDQHKEWIGHVHTAGNPGRAELDDRQEINYPPIMRALVQAGYKGFVGHEFLPTRDPLVGLAEAVRVCDV